MRRFLQLAFVGLALIGVVAVVSAQAAGNTKPYTANVRVENAAQPNVFRLTLTNDPHAQQSLGSANFMLPAGFSAPDGTTAITNVTGSNASVVFDVSVVSNVVEFRATSSSTGLGAGEQVYADVAVTINSCTLANWGVQARQSNDFSGAPGNFMGLNPASDLTPLGSFVVSRIQSFVSGNAVPQILTNTAQPVTISALDTCGNPDADYTGGTLAPNPDNPPRLVHATFTGPTWSGGTGTASFTPTDVEVQDNVVATDPTTQISATSPATFDVVERICALSGTTCTWHNNKGTITATSTVGAGNGGTPSLGLGFRSTQAVCNIAGKATGSVGDLIQIVPLNYADGIYTVTLTYSKAIAPNGPATGFNICKNSDPNGAGTWMPLAQCAKVIVAPCDVPTKVSGGALQVVLYLNPGDPLSGGFN